MDDEALRDEATRFRQDVISIHEEVGKVIAGQKRVIECTVTALVAGGNVLLEGVPGLGKTELVKTLAKVLDLDFKRIQFTPDLMPADIIGTKVMTSDAAGRYQFEFRRGPIFTQLLLADEINRATPKTQSALLETMQERSVTADGTTHHLKPPFFVLATQNPLEQEGTYPLPEAQLDRFMFKTTVPFLSLDELDEVLLRTIVRKHIDVAKIMDGERIMALRDALDHVVIAPPMLNYASRLVLATHPDTEHASEQVKTFVRWGASPRAGQALLRAARIRALTDGRVHVAFEDVRHFAVEVLGHRVLLNYDGQAEGLDIHALINDAVSHTAETV
jgi:MoxR-like ATPase